MDITRYERLIDIIFRFLLITASICLLPVPMTVLTAQSADTSVTESGQVMSVLIKSLTLLNFYNVLSKFWLRLVAC